MQVVFDGDRGVSVTLETSLGKSPIHHQLCFFLSVELPIDGDVELF
jgi:hypothetical protein